MLSIRPEAFHIADEGLPVKVAQAAPLLDLHRGAPHRLTPSVRRDAGPGWFFHPGPAPALATRAGSDRRGSPIGWTSTGWLIRMPPGPGVAEIRAAISSARCSDGTSTNQKPASTSLVFEKGPSVMIGP